ncbi:MAG TPA: transcriptional regulator [Candidatus Atribacteria bacterium]|nr:transcriptional regulator [Candidatus Atribacteria bacterium]
MNDLQFSQLEKIKILSRLKRIEGQIRGIQKMIVDERSCSDIMVQIAAVKAALNQVNKLLVENHVNSCFNSSLSSKDISQDTITDIMNLIIKFLR